MEFLLSNHNLVKKFVSMMLGFTIDGGIGPYRLFLASTRASSLDNDPSSEYGVGELIIGQT